MMKHNEMILTFDIGTTGNKCTLFGKDGKKLCSETMPYKSIYPKPGWSEQDPGDYWASVLEGTHLLLSKNGINPGAIAAIGLSGHMNGCIPVASSGKVLFNNIIHSDCRCEAEIERIALAFDSTEFYNITGNRIDPHYTLPKILWLKEHYPAVYEDAAFFINSKDYISFKLTGNLGITDFSDASLTGMLDMRKKRWAVEMVRELGIDPSRLPELRRSFDLAGYVTEEAAALTGLKAGTPVVTGGGDGACATRGAGVSRKGQAYNNIGSSSWISTLNDFPIMDREARVFNFCDLDGENYNPTGTVQCATISYDWVLSNIGAFEAEQAKREGENVFAFVEDIVRKVPAGSNGVFFLPYLMGERTPYWDMNTKGAFVGFTLYNKREDLLRATYEGVAYALRSVLDVFEDNNVCVDNLTLIGGGAKSRLWNEIMCNVYRKPVRVHKFPGEATSLGAAMAAGVGVGLLKDFSSAENLTEFSREVRPDEDLACTYERYYRVYGSMYPQLKPIFKEIARLQDHLAGGGV